ncbi:sugar ABC transporter permease [Pseudoruegeria sp. SHC-113]|nr:sugar ABC transporter permease [Pseudoruegeria sp. SHC-113]
MTMSDNASHSGLAPGEDYSDYDLPELSLADRIRQNFAQNWQVYVMLAPMVIYFLVFAYKPMLGLVIAFKDFSLFKGIWGSPWVGFEHFETLFNDPYFWRAVKNTVIISVFSLIFAFPAPIILALMFNELRHQGFKKTAQTIAYLPHFISIVIVAGIVVNFFSPSGIVNLLLTKLGMDDPIYFLTMPEWFRPIFIGSNIWKEAGFESIIYLAAIAGVSPTLYESAKVDGATRFQMMYLITLPCILPTILIMLIIRIGNLLEVSFEYVILLYQPATYETADVITTWIYRQGLQNNNYDVATAAGVFNAVVAFALVITANRLSKRVSRTGLW